MTRFKSVMQDPIVSAILDTWPGAVVKMRDPNQAEIEGLLKGGEAGGEFLESIGKTDLASLSFDEWMSFIEKVIRTYEKTCMDLYTDGGDNPPF